MKKAGQYPVIVNSLHAENPEPALDMPGKSGIDSPSEKESPVPEGNETPTMCALPVDPPGSPKYKSKWKAAANDETEQIIATGYSTDAAHGYGNL